MTPEQRYRSSPKGRAKRAEIQQRRHRCHRERLNEIKLARGCADCGYREHPFVLDFDHRDPSQKLFQLGTCTGRSWAAIQAEIEKCDVVCANCHRIRTHLG